ncbi:MAG TPA: hypothetical protein VH834_18060 [Solirubrobacteraceae bacterium]
MSEPAELALPAPTIAVALELPVYGVKVTVGVPAGAKLLNVWRTGPSGTVAYVRTAYQRAVTGPTSAIAHDFEAPFGVPLVYTAQVTLADGSQASQVSAAPFTLEPPDDYPWLNDLMRPTNAGEVVVEAFAPQEYDVPAGVHRILERRTPIVSSDFAHTPTAELVLVTLDEAARERVRNTLGNGRPVLLRTLPEQGVGNIYLAITGWSEARVSRVAQYAERRFTIETVQVDRPDPRLYAPVAPTSYADVKATYATYAALKAAVASYDELMFNFATAGAQVLAVPWPPADL